MGRLDAKIALVTGGNRALDWLLQNGLSMKAPTSSLRVAAIRN
jgi:hypothetical protein